MMIDYGTSGIAPRTFRTSVLLPCLRVVSLVGCALAVVSCGSDCFIRDQVTILDAKDGVYLVLRVAGFQQKTLFYEVYQGKPEFDECGFTKTPMITEEAFAPDALVKKVKWHHKQLLVVYTRKRSESIEPSQARLSP